MHHLNYKGKGGFRGYILTGLTTQMNGHKDKDISIEDIE